MAVLDPPRGYECEFPDSVPDELLCKKCTLVARRLVITGCCGESFCQTCIADTNTPCPACGSNEVSSFKHVKNQRLISNLRVYCSMKERGCVWSGPLDQLDTHLDPDLDNCQYVDTKCPLNCLQAIPKNKVDQHVAQECTKRPHVCQHCGFKATYEEVVDTHLPECKYVALQCPNMCGVSGERELMEDHMKICRLEEVECEFSSVGCDGRFIREDQDEHARQNSQKHLTLTASLAAETKLKLQEQEKSLQEQDKKHKEEEDRLKKKIEEQEKEFVKLEQKLKDQEKISESYASKLNVLEEKLQNVIDQSKISERTISHCDKQVKLSRRFVMDNFSRYKTMIHSGYWKSPAMYTHVGGHKFCLEVGANMSSMLGPCVEVFTMPIPGEFDEELKWPVNVQYTIEVINQQGGQNAKRNGDRMMWDRPRISSGSTVKQYRGILLSCPLLLHRNLRSFLVDDALHFEVSKMKILHDESLHF